MKADALALGDMLERRYDAQRYLEEWVMTPALLTREVVSRLGPGVSEVINAS